MRRAPLTLILALGLVMGSVAAVAAEVPTKDSPRAGSPAAGTPTASQSLDLAAMVLRPSDMPSPDFGIAQSYRYGIDLYDGATRQTLQDADWQAGYEVALGQATTESHVQFEVQAALDVFAEPKGAATGLHVFADHFPSGFDYVKGTRTIGEESSLNGGQEIDQSLNASRNVLTLVFRYDRVVGTIYVDDYTGEKPSVATIETLGDKFLARVKAGLAGAGPDLGHRLVALVDVGAQLTVTDTYWRLNGQLLPLWNDTPANVKTRAGFYQGATDVYALGQSSASGDSAPFVMWRLATFPTEAVAGQWAKTYFALNQQAADAPWTITPQSGQSYGDQGFTQTISYTYPSQNAPDGKAYGVAIIARFGTTAVVLRIEGVTPMPLSAAETLMTTEAGCIDAATPCPTVPVPSALTSA